MRGGYKKKINLERKKDVLLGKIFRGRSKLKGSRGLGEQEERFYFIFSKGRRSSHHLGFWDEAPTFGGGEPRDMG